MSDKYGHWCCLHFLWIFLFAFATSMESQFPFREEQCSIMNSTAASRKFSYGLFKTASNLMIPRRNILISPLAVGMALSMVTNGASGWSRDQIFRVLEQRSRYEPSNLDPDCLLQAYHGNRYNDQFIIKDDKWNTDAGNIALLRTGTRLFGERSYVFREEFVQYTGKYGAEMDVANFNTSPTIASKKINTWVSEQTEGTVQNIFSHGQLTRDTVLAATCAIYFKGSLQTPFVNGTTAPFYVYGKRYRTLNFMSMYSPIRHMFSEKIKANMVEIPYASPDGSNVNARLILILPDKQVTLRSVESQLSDDLIMPLLNRELSHDVEIHVPKMNLYGDQKVKFYLKRMGIREIFNPDKARLHGLAFDDPELHRLFLGFIRHKARFQIDEHGTQVSSAIQPLNSNGYNGTSPLRTHSLRFDRPFVFLIYDKFSENIILMGRVSDPLRVVS